MRRTNESHAPHLSAFTALVFPVSGTESANPYFTGRLAPASAQTSGFELITACPVTYSLTGERLKYRGDWERRKWRGLSRTRYTAILAFVQAAGGGCPSRVADRGGGRGRCGSCCAKQRSVVCRGVSQRVQPPVAGRPERLPQTPKGASESYRRSQPVHQTGMSHAAQRPS